MQPRSRFTITPFRVDLGSLSAEKGLVLLNRSAHRLAPLVVIVRGAQLFWGFLAVVCCALRPFPCAEAVYSRSDVEFPCRCAPFSVGRGSASLARWFAFAPSCGTSRCFALRFRVFAPSARVASTASHPFVVGLWKKRADFHLSTIGFPQACPPCGETVHHPLRIPPRLSLSPPQGTPTSSRRVDEKCPSRAYIYNIGAAKGEEGSAPSAAFRGGRGGSVRRGADRWPRPMDKGLAGGQDARKGVGERAVRGAVGAPVGRRQAKAPGGAHGVCTRVATVGEEEGLPGRCACTIRAQRQVELPNEVCKL